MSTGARAHVVVADRTQCPPPHFTAKCMHVGSSSLRSQFFITLRGDDLSHLDGRHTIFGEVAEGLEVLDYLSAELVDGAGRPYVFVCSCVVHTTRILPRCKRRHRRHCGSEVACGLE